MEPDALALETRIDVHDLERLMQEVDPAVRLVDPRTLRNIIKRQVNLPGLGLQAPHRKSIVLSRDDLLARTGCRELGIDSADDLPDQLILIVRPDGDRLSALGREDALLKYWRLLFHASIHRELEAVLRQNK